MADKLNEQQLADIAPVILGPEAIVHKILTDVDAAGCLSSCCGHRFGASFRHTYSIACKIAQESKLCKEGCWDGHD